MVVHLTLKQAGRSVIVAKDVLRQELALAVKERRNSDAYVIKQKLLEMGWDEAEEEASSVTPEMSKELERDQYWTLIQVLGKINPPRFKKSIGSGRSQVVVSAHLLKLVGELHLLIERLKNANATPGGKQAHHELGASETDLLIGQQIHLAQTDILIFINRLIHEGAAVGDPDQELLDALLACGFISVLQDYLQEQGCNMQGAAVLKKALERIQCTGKSSTSSKGEQEKK